MTCLTPHVSYLDATPANENGGLYYQTELESSGYGVAALTPYHNYEIPCAVCRYANADLYMQAGTRTCPSGMSSIVDGAWKLRMAWGKRRQSLSSFLTDPHWSSCRLSHVWLDDEHTHALHVPQQGFRGCGQWREREWGVDVSAGGVQHARLH